MTEDYLRYVIRQKSTGYLFPNTGRGSTHAVFSPNWDCRLFNKPQYAKSCLKWWLKGTYNVQHIPSNGFESDYDEIVTIVPQPDRIPEDYEIVGAILTLGEVIE